MLRGRLDPEVGAALQKALAWGEDALYPKLGERRSTPAEARRADALGVVAEAALQPGSGERRPMSSDRFQVVLHVEPSTLRAEEEPEVAAETRPSDGECRIERGPRVSAETSRRLACDAGLIVMAHDASGQVLDVGRKTRTIPPALRRALDRRDGGCRFPGCDNRFCDAHHVVHWADGGATNLANTLLVCRLHHRALHEDGYRLIQGSDGQVRFTAPDGSMLLDAPIPPAASPDPLGDFERHHDHMGVSIDRWTPTPKWLGEPLDLPYAVSVLREASIEAGRGNPADGPRA